MNEKQLIQVRKYVLDTYVTSISENAQRLYSNMIQDPKNALQHYQNYEDMLVSSKGSMEALLKDILGYVELIPVRVGSCENCGYDYTNDKLSGNKETGAVVCPKCGKDTFNWD